MKITLILMKFQDTLHFPEDTPLSHEVKDLIKKYANGRFISGKFIILNFILFMIQAFMYF
jgi:hypothetical protein